MIPNVPFKKHKILGHTQAFAKDTLGFVVSCAKAALPMAKARIAFRDFVILLDPEAIRHVLQKNHRNYKKSFAYKGLKEFLGEGLLTAEGDRWLNNRRAIQASFHRKIIQEMEQAIEGVVAHKLQQLPIDKEINLQSLFLEWTRDIMLKALFGLALEDIPAMGNVHEHLWFLRNYANDRMKNPLMAPPSWPTKTNRQFRKAVQELEGIILELFKQSSQSDNGCLLIQQMLEQQKAGIWNDQQIFDEIITLFLAGQETTTNAMIFLVHSALQHPDELAKAIGDESGEQWRCFIEEVLRMYPPAWAVSRQAINEDMVLDKPIKEGTTMFLSIYAMQRHPQYWEDPNDFIPARFQGDYPKQAYLPFGLGPRMCIGNHFALLEMRIMAKRIFKQYNITIANEKPLELITPMTMGPKEAYKVIFTNKRS